MQPGGALNCDGSSLTHSLTHAHERGGACHEATSATLAFLRSSFQQESPSGVCRKGGIARGFYLTHTGGWRGGSCNGAGTRGALGLAEGIKSNDSLALVDVDHNTMHEEGGAAIQAALQVRPPQLRCYECRHAFCIVPTRCRSSRVSRLRRRAQTRTSCFASASSDGSSPRAAAGQSGHPGV